MIHPGLMHSDSLLVKAVLAAGWCFLPGLDAGLFIMINVA
jgi:hypothetical protein